MDYKGEPMDNQANHPARRAHPTRMAVEVTTRCNLRCAMCVKQTPGNGVGDGDMSEAVFRRLLPAFQHLDALVLNGVGEPLMHPQFEDLVRLARRNMREDAWLGFQTNGLLLTPARATALAAAGADRICLSVDSAAPKTFRKLRAGGELDDVRNAFGALAEAGRHGGNPNFRAGAEVVVLRDTVEGLPDVVRWAAGQGARFVLVTHMMPYVRGMAKRVAHPPFSDATLELYHRWRDKGLKQGVDLDQYLDLLWGGVAAPARGPVLELAKGMMREALKRDMWLRPEALAARDESLIARVEDYFAKAGDVAREEGIDLRLPSVLPTFQRRCEFVEKGGSFVARDGSVHPCYFLWHRYACELDGRAKPVTPMPFGSVNGQGVDAFWSGEAWRNFREDMLRYDWPYCLDCAMTPCDLIETSPFEHDCYGSPVPCGDCPWALGLMQCLF